MFRPKIGSSPRCPAPQPLANSLDGRREVARRGLDAMLSGITHHLSSLVSWRYQSQPLPPMCPAFSSLFPLFLYPILDFI
jgi:hypothetical protein